MFNSNNFIKSLKESYDAVPYIQGDGAAKTMVASSIKSNGFNPEDVFSFISSKMGISSVLTAEEWKSVINAAIKREGLFGQCLKVFKTSLSDKLSNEEIFNLAAACSGINPTLLTQELRMDKLHWTTVVDTLLSSTPAPSIEEPADIKEEKAPDPRSKSITLYNGTEKKVWASYRDCEKELNVGHGSISQLVSGKLKSIKGWVLHENKTAVEAQKGSAKRGVVQLEKDQDGNLKIVKTFSSISDASKATGISHSGICKVLSGTYQSTGGYFWKAAEATA